MDCLPCEKQPGLVSQAKLCINKQFTVQHTLSSGEGRVLWKSGETAASQSWPDFIVFSFCSTALTGKDHPTLFLSLPTLLSSCPPPQKPDDVQAPQSRTFKRYHYHFKEPAAALQTYKLWYVIAIATNCVITLYCFIAKWWPAPACYTCQTMGGQCSVAIRERNRCCAHPQLLQRILWSIAASCQCFKQKPVLFFFLLLSITWQIWSREGLQASEDAH